MVYYDLKADPDTYDALALADIRKWSIVGAFGGQALAASWKALAVEVVQAKKRGDFPYLSPGVPVLNERAWKALEPIIGTAVEALPLKAGAERYYALNVVNVLDCLDPTASEITRMPSGTIMSIRRFVFVPEVVAGHDIFKVRGAELKYVIVSSRIKSAFKRHRLVGAVFEPVG